MAATQYRQLILSEGTLAKPGLSFADYSQAGSDSIQRHSSTTGINGVVNASQKYITIGVDGLEKLRLDASGATASALGIVGLYNIATPSRVLTWNTQNGQVGGMPLPTVNGSALVGDINGALSWGTVTPGFHTHRMSANPAQMIFDAALIPATNITYALGTAGASWNELYVRGLTVTALTNPTRWDVAISARALDTLNAGDLVWRHQTTGVLSVITSPTNTGNKILKWVNGSILWGDETGGDGSGIGEAPAGGLIYGRQNGQWVEVKQPIWVVSQISFNDNVIPTAGWNLGSDASRWGLYATNINANGNALISGTLGVSGRITGSGGLTLSAGIGLTSPTSSTYRGLFMHATSGVVIQSDATDVRSWLGLYSAIEGSGVQYNFGVWADTDYIASTNALVMNQGFVEVTNTHALAIAAGAGFFMNGVKFPNIPSDTQLYGFRANGSANASWEAFTPGGGGGGVTTQVRFNSYVDGLAASPTGYDASGSVSLVLTGSPLPKVPSTLPNGKVLKLVNDPETGKDPLVANMAWQDVGGVTSFATSSNALATDILISHSASTGPVTVTLTAGALAVPKLPDTSSDNVYVIYRGAWVALRGTGTMNVEVS